MFRTANVAALFFVTLVLCASCAGVPRAQGQDAGLPSYLTPEESRAADLYQRVLPTVVTIFTAREVVTEEEQSQQRTIGSGVLISKENHVLTAAHVVENAERIVVKSHDGTQRAARVVFSESSADIALIRFGEPEPQLAYATLGDSSLLAVGQSAYAVGSPFGLENSFSVGHISGFREFDRLYDGSIRAEFIQTDAAINIGSSGGPLFNSAGEVIGIASRIVSSSGGSHGVGLVVAINTAKQLLALEDRVWLGIEAIYLDSEMISSLMNRNLEGGMLVTRILKDSPAARAGLQGGTIPARVFGRDLLLGGDLILEFGGQTICDSECLIDAKKYLSGLNEIRVQFLRGGEQQETVIDASASRRNFLKQ